MGRCPEEKPAALFFKPINLNIPMTDLLAAILVLLAFALLGSDSGQKGVKKTKKIIEEYY